MHFSQLDPDITTYNIWIHGFWENCKINQAVRKLDELLCVGLTPNSVTYNIIMNGICGDILSRAMIVAAKLFKMAIIPNVVTANVLLTHFCKEGMSSRALMWGKKMGEISEVDEVTFKIMARACQLIQRGFHDLSGISKRNLFLDSFMYITYAYLCRNRVHGDVNNDLLTFFGMKTF